MSVSENLMQEHQLILSYCDLMQRYAAFSRNNPDSPLLVDNAGIFIGFIQEFADTFHTMPRKKTSCSAIWKRPAF